MKIETVKNINSIMSINQRLAKENFSFVTIYTQIFQTLHNCKFRQDVLHTYRNQWENVIRREREKPVIKQCVNIEKSIRAEKFSFTATNVLDIFSLLLIHNISFYTHTLYVPVVINKNTTIVVVLWCDNENHWKKEKNHKRFSNINSLQRVCVNSNSLCRRVRNSILYTYLLSVLQCVNNKQVFQQECTQTEESALCYFSKHQKFRFQNLSHNTFVTLYCTNYTDSSHHTSNKEYNKTYSNICNKVKFHEQRGFEPRRRLSF